MAVLRGQQLTKNKAELFNIGLFYKQYILGLGDTPPSLADFEAFIMKDARNEYQALKDGRYVLIVTANPTSSSLLAYEKNADYNGNLLVVMGDGTVKLISKPEFEKELKKKEG